MLDARQLEALAAVVEHRGFGPAAQALNLTLAAVSLRIKSLEEHLGQRLLVRGKLVRATAAGQSLLAHVKQLQMMEFAPESKRRLLQYIQAVNFIFFNFCFQYLR